MANVLELNFDYTYPGQLTTDVFFKPSIGTPDLSIFRVIPNIQSKRELNLLNPLQKVVKAYSGCGTRTESGTGLNITNRTLEVTEVEMYLNNCKDAFENSVVEAGLNAGIERNDLTNTFVNQFVTDLTLDSLRRDNFRILSFGDTGSGDANFNMLDGLWTKLIAGVSDYEVTRIGGDISGALSAGDAEDLLRQNYEGANQILKEIPEAQKRFLVTGTIYDNYRTSLENKSGTEGSFRILQDGSTQLFFRGIEVVPVRAWDTFIEANSLGAPNRIIYTELNNHVVGTNRLSDLNRVDAWYDRDTRFYKIEAQYRMGYNYVHGDLQTISY